MRALRPAPALVLTTASVVVALLTFFWIHADTGIAPPTDSAHHLFNALLFSRDLRLGGLARLWEATRLSYVGWPPGANVLLYAPFGSLVSDDSQAMRAAGLLLVPLLVWATYRLAADMGRDRRLATLAALLTVFSFGISGQLRQVSIDLPATVGVLLAVLALLRTGGFSRPWATMLFGAACGLCLFTRVQSMFFLSGPVAAVAFRSLARTPTWPERARRLAWASCAALVALALSAPWWYGRVGELVHVSMSHVDPSRVAPRGDPGLLAGLLYYAAATGKLAGWPTVIAALGGLTVLGARRGRALSADATVVPAWIATGIAGCCLGVHREPRYLLPAVPALALLAVFALRALPPRPRDLLGALLAFAVIGPTLAAAAFPVHGNHALARHGIVEWAYVRPPFQVRHVPAARAAATALLRVSGHDRRGARVHLVFAQDARVNFLPRLGSYLVPLFPDLSFSSTMNPLLANTRWRVVQRRDREVFVLSEIDRPLALPALWTARKGAYDNLTPIRLHHVPAPHPLRQTVDEATVRRWTEGAR